MIALGDLLVVGKPPAKFLKALAVIADSLHPSFGLTRLIPDPDKSKKSCILTSMTTREFLSRIGFRDADIRPCMFVAQAHTVEGKFIHSLGIGEPDMAAARANHGKPGWSGHMIVVVPSLGYLVDATLFQANRPHWPELPGMIAAPLRDPALPPAEPQYGLMPLAGYVGARADGSEIELAWLHQPVNQLYRRSPDFKRRDWHRAVADRLAAKFGKWEDAA